MRFVSVAEVKNRLSVFLAEAQKKKAPIVVTHHGRPYALIQPIYERDLEGLGWERLAEDRLREVWEGEDDALYDYLATHPRSRVSRARARLQEFSVQRSALPSRKISL